MITAVSNTPRTRGVDASVTPTALGIEHRYGTLANVVCRVPRLERPPGSGGRFGNVIESTPPG